MYSLIYKIFTAACLISPGKSVNDNTVHVKQRLSSIGWEKSNNTVIRDDNNFAENPSPCSDLSFKQPDYQINDFQFNRTTTERGERGLVHFDLEDVANNYSLTCTTPYLQDPNNFMWNDCEPAENSTYPKTIFQYIVDQNRIAISQTWVCELENRTFPHPYMSTAEVDLPSLECANATAIECILRDNGMPTFGGKYTMPVWSSNEGERIQPSPNPPNATANAPWNETPCVGLSFSYPNWDVENFTSSSTDGDVSVRFHLRNHANNQTTTCDYQGSGWHQCDNTTEVKFDGVTFKLSINQTWTCNATDKWSYYPDLINFRAVASSGLSLECEESNCYAPNSVAKGSLIEPIELTPNVAPDGVDVPGCLENSVSPSWEVTSFIWNEIYRSSRKVGNVTVVMRNLANDFNLTCEAQGEELNAEGSEDHERWWGCASANNPFDDFRVTTLIQLNPVTQEFATKQTWYCNGNDLEPPAKIIGNGTLDTALDCSWKNSTYENVRVCQATGPQILNGTQESRTDLPRDAFVEVPPKGYSCTISSVTAPKWRVTLQTDTLYTDPLTSTNDFSTRLYDPITATPFSGYQMVDYEGPSLTPFLNVSEPGRWYECKNYGRTENDGSSSEWARNTLDCRWQLDLATGYFALNHTWFCDDKDPEHP
ncbi:hypothetical protein F4810DRAFT_718068 [Camillea tinctor]|nr:hypothetical protein F4810DRAFT_718068 [Camillea tinctor]